MISKVLLAGFGGQGIILAGKLLAEAAMREQKEVTHLASYGAEMRGGTCNCSVVVSDASISSPVIVHPDILLAMNAPSLTKFAPLTGEGSLIIVNSTLITKLPDLPQRACYGVQATLHAEQLGSVRIANMVMLGALSRASGLVSLDSLKEALDRVISARNKSLIAGNIKALEDGFSAVEKI